MAITQRTTLDPATAASNWSQRVSQSGTKFVAGVQKPRRLPNADPAKNTASWTQGVAQAAPTFQAAISAPDYLTKLEAGATTKVGNYTAAGARSKGNAQAAFSKVFPAIQGIVASLPARGPVGTNGARSTQMQEALHALRGTLGVRKG